MTAVAPPRPEPKRDHYGRYMVHNPAGRAVGYTRATTIAGTVDDKYNIHRWEMRHAVKGACSRRDLVTSAQAHDPDDDKKLFEEIVEDALEASGATAGRRLGTALHKLTEDLDSGRRDLADMPKEWQPTLTAYRDAIRKSGLVFDPDHTEQVVLNDDYMVAGTCDRVASLAGSRFIADVKTGKSLGFGQLAMATQLSIYANHQATYDYADMTRGPRINVERDIGYIIHLPARGPEAGTCTVYRMDLRVGHEGFLSAIEIRGLRKDAKRCLSEHQPGIDDKSVREWIAERILNVQHHGGEMAVEMLRKEWPKQVPKPTPVNPTSAETDLIVAHLERVEARFEIPFIPEMNRNN